MTASSMQNRKDTSQRGFSQTLALLAAIVLVALAPIFRGGNRFVPLTVLEGLGMAVFLAWGWHALFSINAPGRSPLGIGSRRWALIALITSPAWVALIQLIPLPSGGGWQALSEVPKATWAAALAGIPIAAMFLAALASDTKSLQLLARAWVMAAVFQGAMGLLQLGGFEALHFNGPKTEGVVGTFANRNHFASFLAMAIPLAMLSLKPQKIGSLEGGAVSWPAIAMLFVLVAALFASLSRAGLVVGLMAAVATSGVLFRPAQRRRQARSSWMWALIPLLVVLAMAAGGLDWLYRFDASQLEASAYEREINRLSAWAAAKTHWPMGSGLGTFASAFTPYQAAEIEQFVDYAHNDYVQWLLELGVVFVVIAAIVVALVWQRAAQMIRGGGRGSEQDRLALASAMGLLAVALHAWVDFPLRIPANAMLAAFLLGLFLRAPTDGRGLRRPSAGSHRTESGARAFEF